MAGKGSFRKSGFSKNRGALRLSYFLRGGALLILLSGVSAIGLRVYEWALSAPCFSVSSVKISPMVLMKEEDILRISGFTQGENLFSLNSDDMEERLAVYPWIESASVKREFPDGIVITVKERFPSVILVADKIYLLDKDGFMLSFLEELPELSIPVITDPKKHSALPGDRLESPALSAAGEVLAAAGKTLLRYENQVSEVELIDDGRVRVLTRAASVPVYFDRFAVEEGFTKLSYMKNILRQKGVEEVDLSFRNQVVVRRKIPERSTGGDLALAGEL